MMILYIFVYIHLWLEPLILLLRSLGYLNTSRTRLGAFQRLGTISRAIPTKEISRGHGELSSCHRSKYWGNCSLESKILLCWDVIIWNKNGSLYSNLGIALRSRCIRPLEKEKKSLTRRASTVSLQNFRQWTFAHGFLQLGEQAIESPKRVVQSAHLPNVAIFSCVWSRRWVPTNVGLDVSTSSKKHDQTFPSICLCSSFLW